MAFSAVLRFGSLCIAWIFLTMSASIAYDRCLPGDAPALVVTSRSYRTQWTVVKIRDA
jgi:hypothetical protein